MKGIKEPIVKYIQFAIKNGFNEKIDGLKIIGLNGKGDYIVERDLYYGRGSDTETIMSKAFISAIIRGYNKMDTALSFVEDEITIQQAIAIRENKLEQFINNILPGNQ